MVRTTKVSYTLSTERNNSKGNENKNFWKFGRRLKRNHEMKILRRNISESHGKKGGSDKKISQLKLNLRETFGMPGNFVENTVI